MVAERYLEAPRRGCERWCDEQRERQQQRQAAGLRRDRRRRRPQRAHRRGLPGARRPARVRARAPRRARRRVRDRGAVAGHRVSRASYVVSMLQPKVVADLELRGSATSRSRWTRRSRPSPPTAGRSSSTTTREPPASRSRASRARTPRRCRASGADRARPRSCKPMMLRAAGGAGSKPPGDVLELLREAGRAAGLSRRELLELYRVMTMSVGDLLDDWFETTRSRARTRRPASSACGPAVHARHSLQPPAPRARRGRRRAGRVGPRARRDGRDLQGDRRQRPGRGRDVRTGAPVASIDVDDGRVTGVTLVERRDDHGAARPLGRAPEAHGARPRRRRALPRRGRRRHAPLPHPRGLGEGQLRSSPSRRATSTRPPTRASSSCTPAWRSPVDRLPRARLAGRDARPARRRARTSRSRCRPRSTRR